MKEIIDVLLNDNSFREGVDWKRYRVGAGVTLVRKGDVGDTVFFLEEGKVRVLGEADLGESHHISPGLCDLGPGEIFGDVCLYSPHERTATVVALTDSCLIEIHGQRLGAYLDGHPLEGYRFLKSIFQAMVNRLALDNERIGHLLAWGIKAHDIDKFL